MLDSLTLLTLFLLPAAPEVSSAPQEPGAVPEITAQERLSVAGTPVELSLWREQTGDGVESSWYRISLDGQSWSRARQARPEIQLRWGTFDPLAAPPDHSSSPLAPDGNLYIVQFVTQSLQAYRDTLTAMGAEVSWPMPNHAHVVRMDPATKLAVEALPWVRWVGIYHPAYRLDPGVSSALSDGTLESARYRIQVMERGPALKEIVAERLMAAGGVVDLMIPDGFILEATLSSELLSRVVTWDEVLYVDPWSEPEEDMNNVRIIGGANHIESTYGYTGQGVRAECFDGNVNAAHPDLQNNPVIFHGPHGGSTSHGTPVTGCVFGTGATSAAARGMCPDGQPIFADYGYLSNRYTHTAQLLQSPYYAVFQTNSWGNSQVTYYSSYSFEMDDILFQYDIVILQSQSNTGWQASRPQAWAKNIVGVGGIRHYDTLSTSDDCWCGGASIGPAEDGRIKPDLHYWYDYVYTLTSSGHGNFSGTSAATPTAAGHFGLFYQMWHEGVWPGRGGAATVFESRPKATTARAMIVNTAWSYPFSGTGSDLTRTHQGWGRPDLKRMSDYVPKTFIVDEEYVLKNLESKSFPLEVAAGESEFRATMVYLDLPGTTSSSQHRINDLSLKVTSPGGTVYWGNNGLAAGNVSTAGGSSNTKDVIENVFVVNPTAGTWMVEVLADEIVADQHTETGAVDADFALVVTGVTAGGQYPEYCTCDVLNPSGNVAPCGNYNNGTTPLGGCRHDDSDAGAHLGASGIANLSSDSLVFHLTRGPNANSALFFQADNNLDGTGNYIGDGVQCAGGALKRLEIRFTSGGSANTTIGISGKAGNISPGDTKYYQVWIRDPGGSPCGNESNTSNGVEVTWGA